MNKARLRYIPLILGLVFFLAQNTHYFYEVYLGIFQLFILPVFFGIWIILILCTSYQISLIVTKRSNLILAWTTTIVLVSIICCSVYRPLGIIDFSKYEKNLCIASYTGGLDNTTQFKFRENNTVVEEIFFWGRRLRFGTYAVQDDSIIMQFPSTSKDPALRISAIIKPLDSAYIKYLKANQKNATHALNIAESPNDSIPMQYVIYKNSLFKLLP